MIDLTSTVDLHFEITTSVRIAISGRILVTLRILVLSNYLTFHAKIVDVVFVGFSESPELSQDRASLRDFAIGFAT